MVAALLVPQLPVIRSLFAVVQLTVALTYTLHVVEESKTVA